MARRRCASISTGGRGRCSGSCPGAQIGQPALPQLRHRGRARLRGPPGRQQHLGADRAVFPDPAAHRPAALDHTGLVAADPDPGLVGPRRQQADPRLDRTPGCPGWDSNPHDPFGPGGFKPPAPTDYATRAGPRSTLPRTLAYPAATWPPSQ